MAVILSLKLKKKTRHILVSVGVVPSHTNTRSDKFDIKFDISQKTVALEKLLLRNQKVIITEKESLAL